jgi:hypothetical protein
MAVSTMVYNCWKILPNISGNAKENRSFIGLPVVMLSVRAITTPFVWVLIKFYLHIQGLSRMRRWRCLSFVAIKFNLDISIIIYFIMKII